MNKRKFISDMLKVCKEHKVEVLWEEHVQNEYFSHTITVKRPKPLKKKANQFVGRDVILNGHHSTIPPYDGTSIIGKSSVVVAHPESSIVNGNDNINTGICKIDDIAKGGYKRGEIYLFMGKENCGRSVLKDNTDTFTGF